MFPELQLPLKNYAAGAISHWQLDELVPLLIGDRNVYTRNMCLFFHLKFTTGATFTPITYVELLDRLIDNIRLEVCGVVHKKAKFRDWLVRGLRVKKAVIDYDMAINETDIEVEFYLEMPMAPCGRFSKDFDMPSMLWHALPSRLTIDWSNYADAQLTVTSLYAVPLFSMVTRNYLRVPAIEKFEYHDSTDVDVYIKKQGKNFVKLFTCNGVETTQKFDATGAHNDYGEIRMLNGDDVVIDDCTGTILKRCYLSKTGNYWYQTYLAAGVQIPVLMRGISNFFQHLYDIDTYGWLQTDGIAKGLECLSMLKLPGFAFPANVDQHHICMCYLENNKALAEVRNAVGGNKLSVPATPRPVGKLGSETISKYVPFKPGPVAAGKKEE